jgi:hypothetical protein
MWLFLTSYHLAVIEAKTLNSNHIITGYIFFN